MFDAMERVAVESASAGDIVTVAGLSDFTIGDTVVDPAEPRPLPPITVEQAQTLIGPHQPWALVIGIH